MHIGADRATVCYLDRLHRGLMECAVGLDRQAARRMEIHPRRFVFVIERPGLCAQWSILFFDSCWFVQESTDLLVLQSTGAPVSKLAG